MGKKTFYTESRELRELAEKLKPRYYTIVGYIELEKIFFAFKGGDESDDIGCEVVGLKSDWVSYVTQSEDPKMYCISMSYGHYQKILGSNLEWTLLDALYSCSPEMDGKLRPKRVHEHSRIITTLEDLGLSCIWRNNFHLPPLLGDETISFVPEEADDEPI